MISVTISGDDGVEEHQAKLRAGMQAVMGKTVADTEAHAKAKAPVDTGNLRNAIAGEVQGGGDIVLGEVGSGASYAIYQEFGTRYQPGTPHLIPAMIEVEPSFYAAAEAIAGG